MSETGKVAAYLLATPSDAIQEHMRVYKKGRSVDICE